ncbi:hypothetical protein SAMN05444394_1306 [Algoriphagus halophilus]|uniref:Uncharacterized protein n=1 Tax=Algoriphagus halophilus TaxID=226505 RepID=A0A1N6DRK7_9BACT|nr:hypothetical protein SAMN05444394_1306 [Algoriphagus halophilus]
MDSPPRIFSKPKKPIYDEKELFIPVGAIAFCFF